MFQKPQSFALSSIVALLLVLIVGTVFLQKNNTASAAGPSALAGYAWSDNIGWVSVNCATGGPTGNNICGTSNYKVTINLDKTLTGYAWSDSVGWIKFGGLNSFPVATSSGNAHIDSRNNVVGWARACAGTLGGTCASMTNSADGWDGWISLNCSNTLTCGTANYGLTVGTGSFASTYAWGGLTVGWLNFSQVSYTPFNTPSTACASGDTGVTSTDQWGIQTTVSCSPGLYCSHSSISCVAYAPPTGSLTITPTRVRSNGTVVVSWSTTNADTCTVTGSNGNSFSGGPSGSGTSISITKKTTYTLTCVPTSGGPAAQVDQKDVSITPSLKEI